MNIEQKVISNDSIYENVNTHKSENAQKEIENKIEIAEENLVKKEIKDESIPVKNIRKRWCNRKKMIIICLSTVGVLLFAAFLTLLGLYLSDKNKITIYKKNVSAKDKNITLEANVPDESNYIPEIEVKSENQTCKSVGVGTNVSSYCDGQRVELNPDNYIETNGNLNVSVKDFLSRSLSNNTTIESSKSLRQLQIIPSGCGNTVCTSVAVWARVCIPYCRWISRLITNFFSKYLYWAFDYVCDTICVNTPLFIMRMCKCDRTCGNCLYYGLCTDHRCACGRC